MFTRTSKLALGKTQSVSCRDDFCTHYEVRPRKDHRGVDLISDALPFGRLWYGEPDALSNAIDYAKFRSRSDRAVIRVYDEAGNVIKAQAVAKVAFVFLGQLPAQMQPDLVDHSAKMVEATHFFSRAAKWWIDHVKASNQLRRRA
jgi:hypothetical protein